jgi:hypothetical protein
VEFDGVDDSAGRRWFRETFTAINNGRHTNFSIPEKIAATVPFAPAAGSPFNITVLDTRGIDGSSIRPDIISHLKNERALNILCSKWGSAPDPSIQTLLKHIVETEVDASIFERIVVLIVARPGDALSMKGDSGEHVEDVLEGYEVKIRQALDALERERLPVVDVFAFDASTEDGIAAVEHLSNRIMRLRERQADGARATISAIDQMVTNARHSAAINALRSLNSDLQLFAENSAPLSYASERIYSRLLNNLNSTHPRVIWASVRRNGEYWNFNFFQHLADGAAAELKRRRVADFESLRDLIRRKLGTVEYQDVQHILHQLLEDISAWENDFIKAVRHHTISSFKSRLSNHNIWEETAEMYGKRKPYRDWVVERFDGWFLSQDDIPDELNLKFQLAWRTSVIEPLLRASGKGALQTQ